MVTQRIEKIAVVTALGIVCLALFLGGFFLGKKAGASVAVPPGVAHRDTVWVRDTITTTTAQKTEIPKGFELVPSGTLRIYDSVLAAYKDSLSKVREPFLVKDKDSASLYIPKSDFKFSDEGKTYEFAVNGYDVSFLWHKSYEQTAYITNTVGVPFKWSLYPEAGLSYCAGMATAKVGIGADIGISKNLRFRFVPEAGCALSYVGGSLQKGFYGSVTFKYNLIQK